MKTCKVVLSDGTVMHGYEDEYITNVLSNSGDYYEIMDLERFSRFIPPEPIVYDIGSNIGNHTIYFAKHYKAKKVYSFEPVPMNADILERNVRENKLANVEIFRLAIGGKTGKADPVINERNMGECRLSENPEGSITVVSLDELNLEYPDFVKIDVEETELDVLNGMKNILVRSNPVIWVETKDRFLEVDQFLGQYQYELIDKFNFNHIYVKYKTLEEKLEIMKSFKENIVPEFNRTVIDKWNLNNWLSAEKEKKSHLISGNESYLECLKRIDFNLENMHTKINAIFQQFEAEKQEFIQKIQNYEVEKQELERKVEQYEIERQELKQKVRQSETEKQELYKKIIEHIRMERQALNALKETREYYRLIESRYMRLRTSLPGKMAAAIWKRYKKIKKRG